MSPKLALSLAVSVLTLLCIPSVIGGGGAACSIVASVDYAEGSGGPNFPSPNQTDCCNQCISAGASACWAAVFAPTGCWFKSQAQTQRPVYNSGVSGCWPPGRTPVPPPSPPPPPPPGKYNVSVISLPSVPRISFLAGQTSWPQSFNPAYVAASAGTGGVAGLLVRSQNCTGWTPGACIGCNVDGNHPIAPWFPGSVVSFAAINADGSFERPYLVFAPEADAPFPEDYGTEDPRLTYDPATFLYHLFYTCYSKEKGAFLCHATTTDPTAPIATAKWTRYGAVFPDQPGSKSGALLIRPAPPHYLIWGAGVIALATSPDLYNFTTVNSSFIAPRVGSYDDNLVEAGPSPQLLSDGNYVFFHNSDGGPKDCYNPAYVILSGADPSVILERSAAPLLSPIFDWQLGVAPAECNVPCVVFLEAVAPVAGMTDTFDVWFGGSDAVVGTARIAVTIAAD